MYQGSTALPRRPPPAGESFVIFSEHPVLTPAHRTISTLAELMIFSIAVMLC
jgi:hypothetical protein